MQDFANGDGLEFGVRVAYPLQTVLCVDAYAHGELGFEQKE